MVPEYAFPCGAQAFDGPLRSVVAAVCLERNADGAQGLKRVTHEQKSCFPWARPRVDAGQVAATIPKSLLQPLGAHPVAATDHPMRLTLEGVALCKGSDDDVQVFLHALQWMTFQERQLLPASAADPAARMVTSRRFMRGLRIRRTRDLEVRRVGELLMVERWGWSSAGTQPDGTWT
jgi:hypothetical protein